MLGPDSVHFDNFIADSMGHVFFWKKAKYYNKMPTIPLKLKTFRKIGFDYFIDNVCETSVIYWKKYQFFISCFLQEKQSNY